MFFLRKIITNIISILEFLSRRRFLNYYQTRIKIPSGLDLKTELQFYFRKYEDDEISCILDFFQNSKNIIEIGGGCGVLSAVLDNHLELDSHVVYEAIDINYKRVLSQPIGSNTHVLNYAVISDNEKESELKFRKRNRIFGSGFKKDRQADDILDEYISVPTIRASKAIANDTDLIVMDVEGYESELLPNIALLSNANIVFEYHADKCSVTLGELVILCPTHCIQHYRHSTFFATPIGQGA